MAGARDKKPWYPRYARDFVHGVIGLTPEQIGVYALVLDMIYERGGPIPNDAKKLGGMMGGASTRSVSRILAELSAGEEPKLLISGGWIFNKRAAEVLGQMVQFSELQSQRAQARWKREPLQTGNKTPSKSDLFAPRANDLNSLADAGAMPDRQTAPKTKNGPLFPNYSQTNSNLFAPTLNETNDLADAGRMPTTTTYSRDKSLLTNPAPHGKVPDVKKVIFDVGLPALAAMSGKSAQSLRPLIGKWLHKCGKDPGQILDLIAEADRDPPFDPVSWIEKRLQPKAAPQTSSGQRNLSDAIAQITARK